MLVLKSGFYFLNSAIKAGFFAAVTGAIHAMAFLCGRRPKRLLHVNSHLNWHHSSPWQTSSCYNMK